MKPRSSQTNANSHVALGCRSHSGWAVVVAVARSRDSLAVIDRRQIVIADPKIAGSKQPYHHVEKLALKEAENYIANCSAASRRLASAAIGELIEELDRRAYRVSGSALLMASGRALPSLAEILASHALIHAAEGQFFRSIVHRACEDLGIAVTPLREREPRGACQGSARH